MKDQHYAAMGEHAHVDGCYPFPAVMQTRMIENQLVHPSMCGSVTVMVQRSSCCTASAQRATCGAIWRAHSSKTT